jgi:catechol 2,3-dioxygenase-like lactoylglutathione lyase family enzyme
MNAFQSARIDHVQINVTDLTMAKQFYGGVLELEEVPRPESFDFPERGTGSGRSISILSCGSGNRPVPATSVCGSQTCRRRLEDWRHVAV